jgi:hypothetical protein
MRTFEAEVLDDLGRYRDTERSVLRKVLREPDPRYTLTDLEHDLRLASDDEVLLAYRACVP